MKRKILLPTVVLVFLCLGGCARPLAPGSLAAGVAAAREDRWEEAVRQWTKALELEAGSAAAHNNLAVAFERQGAWDDARREYEAALRLDPTNRTIIGNYDAFKARLEAGRGRTS